MSWSKAYVNDKNGVKVSGSLDVLKRAIRNGSEVRLMLKFDDFPTQEYYTNVENIHIRGEIRGEVVYAQCISHISVDFSNGVMIFKDNAYHWFINVDTKGNMDISRWSIGEHTSQGHTQIKATVSWFVN